MTGELAEILTFGPYRLDLPSFRLTRRITGEQDKVVNLRPKAFDVLRFLVQNAGRTLSQDEFLSELWPQTYVQPEVLKGHVLAVRSALDDRGAPPRYIETVRGRGYRFIADVEIVPNEKGEVDEPAAGVSLVGRGKSRAELDAAMARASAGEAQMVFLTGEAGIGKTTLAENFSIDMSSRGIKVVVGHCLPGSGATDAYYPILEMLTALSGSEIGERLRALLGEIAPTWLIQLPGSPSNGSDLRKGVIDATPHRMARELCDVFDVLARSEPLVVVLEDLQWADRATLDLIQALAGRKLRAKLMIVATLRSSIVGDDGVSAGALAQKLALYRLAREIKLAPFSLPDVEAYLRVLADFDPPEALSRHLHLRSEGNPLFMQAMLDVLLQREFVAVDDDGWHLGEGFSPLGLRAPPSLTQIIEAEIDELPRESQLVVEAASISEGTFSGFANHVASDLGEEAFEAICETLSRRGQLIRRSDLVEMPGGRLVQTYRFRHALFREAAYDRQGALKRATAHRSVADHLAQLYSDDLPAVASGLARHFVEASEWAQTIRFLRIAARTAMQRFAHREATELLEQAMAISRNLPPPERGETQLGVLEELARVYLGIFDLRAAEIYDRLARLARDMGSIDVEARALFGLGYVVSWTDSDRCLEIMSDALAKGKEISDPVRNARVRCSAHGWRNWIQGWSDADAKGVQTALAELRELNDPIALHSSLVDHSLILFPAARYVEATVEVARGFNYLVAHAQEVDVDLSLPLWVTRLGTPWAQMSAGNLGVALDGFTVGFGAFVANGNLGRGATLRMYHAYVHERMHDHAAALQMLDETIALLSESGTRLSPNETKIELVVRGLAELGLGQVDDAIGHLAAAQAEMDARNTLTSWYWRLAVGWGMTDALLMSGDLSAAEARAQRFVEESFAIEERTFRALALEACGRIALARNAGEKARALLARAWNEIDGYDAPLLRWRLHEVEADALDRSGDGKAALFHRESRNAELKKLAASLPAGHPARLTLANARTHRP